MISLFARVLRTTFTLIGLWLIMAAQPLQAAPYAAIVMDARTGETLWSQNADTRLHPASLTKMMTLYITFQEIEAGRLSLDTMVTVSKHAAAQPPSRLGLRPGQKIQVRYLIRAAAIKSANDAAAALGDAIEGSEKAFAQRMTRTARALGMNNTTFRNAHGLTAPGHLSSARDMSLLGRHLFYDFPQYYGIFSRRSEDAGIAKVNNTNRRFLDAYDGADGIKTGYTVAAGFNLTASAKRGDRRLIATVFGGTSSAQRNTKMTEVLNKGFGLAAKGVREKTPVPAPLPPEAYADNRVDTAGGSGKTLRLSGEVTRSPRPQTRGDVVEAPVAMAAISDDLINAIDQAMAEATAPPPPNTLEAQVVDLAQAAPEAAATAVTAPSAEAPTVAAQEASPPALNSLEAQALALAEAEAASDEVAVPRPAARPAALAEAALAALEPEAPAPLAPAPLAPIAAPAAAPPLEEVAVAEVAPETTPAPALDNRDLAALEPSAPIDGASNEAASRLRDVEVVAADADQAVPAPIAPTRRAPIFEAPAEVQLAEAETLEDEPIVLSKSTSGGRSWGVSVGAYNSHYEAERALLRTGLTESATLEEGLRKVTEKGGKFRASFLGLSEEQANLACRRLRARGMTCDTSGPTG